MALGCARMFSIQVRSLGVLWCSYFMSTIHVFFFFLSIFFGFVIYPTLIATLRSPLSPLDSSLPSQQENDLEGSTMSISRRTCCMARSDNGRDGLYLTLHVGWTWHLISLKHVVPPLFILARFMGFDTPPSVLFDQDMQLLAVLPWHVRASTSGRNPSLWRGSDTMPCGKTVSWDQMQNQDSRPTAFCLHDDALCFFSVPIREC